MRYYSTIRIYLTLDNSTIANINLLSLTLLLQGNHFSAHMKIDQFSIVQIRK